MVTALALSRSEAFQARLKLAAGADSAGEIDRLVPSLQRIDEAYTLAIELRWSLSSITALLPRLEAQQGEERFRGRLLDLMSVARGQMAELQRRLRMQPYPFEYGGAEMTLGKFVLPSLPDNDDLAGILRGWDALERLLGLYGRHLGRLAAIAERVETSLEMPVLAELEPVAG